LFATIAVALVAGLLFLRWQLTDQKHGTYTLKDIDEQTPSHDNKPGDDPVNFEPKTSVVARPETDPQPPELQASQVEVQSEQGRAGRKHVQDPDPRPRYYHSLPTNTPIGEDIDTKGLGELTVENGTTEDAVVRLVEVDGERTVKWFSVQAHTSGRVGQIPEGIYRIRFTSGLDWDESATSFRWHPSYSEYERTFLYKEESDSEGVQYKKISVTLNSVVSGNVRTRPITREEFLKGHRHVALQR
jgi:hypothetical protein